MIELTRPNWSRWPFKILQEFQDAIAPASGSFVSRGGLLASYGGGAGNAQLCRMSPPSALKANGFAGIFAPSGDNYTYHLAIYEDDNDGVVGNLIYTQEVDVQASGPSFWDVFDFGETLELPKSFFIGGWWGEGSSGSFGSWAVANTVVPPYTDPQVLTLPNAGGTTYLPNCYATTLSSPYSAPANGSAFAFTKDQNAPALLLRAI